MDDQSFFVDLPSDSSLITRPNNHGGNFTVDLPQTIRFSAYQWEVGLAEIIFQQDWQPLIAEDIWVAFCINDKTGGTYSRCAAAVLEEKQLEKVRELRTFSSLWEKILKPLFERAMKNANLIKAGTSSLNIVEEKNSALLELTVKVFEKDRRTVRLELSQSLLQLLGFTRAQLPDEGRYFKTNTEGEIKTPRTMFPPSIDRAITSLWIYTNIIRPHITGHSFSPLLRVVGVEKSENFPPNITTGGGGGNDVRRLSTFTSFSTRVVQFDRIHYYTLLSDEISQISIMITNESGKKGIKFSAPVVAKLHFRRKASRI